MHRSETETRIVGVVGESKAGCACGCICAKLSGCSTDVDSEMWSEGVGVCGCGGKYGCGL